MNDNGDADEKWDYRTALRRGEGRWGIRPRGVLPHTVIVNVTDKYAENRPKGGPRNKW